MSPSPVSCGSCQLVFAFYESDLHKARHLLESYFSTTTNMKKTQIAKRFLYYGLWSLRRVCFAGKRRELLPNFGYFHYYGSRVKETRHLIALSILLLQSMAL